MYFHTSQLPTLHVGPAPWHSCDFVIVTTSIEQFVQCNIRFTTEDSLSIHKHRWICGIHECLCHTRHLMCRRSQYYDISLNILGYLPSAGFFGRCGEVFLAVRDWTNLVCLRPVPRRGAGYQPMSWRPVVGVLSWLWAS